jgi:DNA polymerase-3 subunit alpha
MVISKLGFSNYFLIVWDFVRHAREQGVPATARGSGVGSLGLLCTVLEPRLPHQVRPCCSNASWTKVEPKRLISTSTSARTDAGEIIRYVKEKYGEANVAQIGTFGTLQARAAIKDVGRAMGLAVGASQPDHRNGSRRAQDHHQEGARSQHAELKALYERDNDVGKNCSIWR